MSGDQLRPSPGGGGVDAEAEAGRRHAPVMVEEAVRFLHLKPGGLYIDGTLGDGGHSQRMLEADASIAVLGVDRDALTLELTAQRLAGFGPRFRTFHGNFSELDLALRSIVELARLVATEVDSGAAVEIAGSPIPGAPASRYVPRVDRAAADLGLTAWIALPDAIRRMARWHRQE